MSFVISQGQMSKVERTLFPHAPMVRLDDNLVEDYAQIWRSQPNVRTVVDFLARNIAQLPIQVFRRVSDTDRERLNDHPLAQLLKRPNYFTTHYRAIDSLIHDMGIYDNAFWVKVRPDSGGQMTGLVRVDPRMVTPIGTTFITSTDYMIQGNGGYLTVPADQMVHFRGYNPDNMRWGCSPIETLRRVLIEEFQAGVYREQLWRNSARMSGYLSRPTDAPMWGKDDRGRFREQWQAQYAGSDGTHAGGTPILEDGMSFTQAAVTPEQAQYLENRKLTREEVAAAYHIPLPMVGILDHATYSNMNQAHAQLYQDTLGPWFQQLSEDIELQLLPEFDDNDGVYVEFNIAAKLAGSFEEQAAVLQSAVGAPYMLRNEARARLNLPELDGGNELVTPLNVLIGGQASPTDSAPPANPLSAPKHVVPLHKARASVADVDKIKALMAAFFARQHKAISSAVGATPDPSIGDVFDDERWDNELTGDLFKTAVPVASGIGRAVLELLGLDTVYDAVRTHSYLHTFAELAATGINDTTKADVTEKLTADEPLVALQELFDGYQGGRADQIGETQGTALSGFGSEEAVKQTGMDGSKTWQVTSKNPRASHAAMDGETVGVEEEFSNGAKWPGDSSLDVDERANCSCEVVMSVS
jgi:HK97 family phage portal protein